MALGFSISADGNPVEASMAGGLLAEYRIRDDRLQNPDLLKRWIRAPGRLSAPRAKSVAFACGSAT
jgi:hypothetical protein